jgi:hypothetical protein
MLAEKLGMTLRECQSRVSSKEFVLWKIYMRDEHNRFHREDYLFAMVASEVRRTIVKNPNKVKVEDFLLKFQEAGKTAEDLEEVKNQKLNWLSFVGLDSEVLGED